MAVHRVTHAGFYILYLITYLLFLFFLLQQLEISMYIFWMFFSGIVILGIGVIQKELFIKRQIRNGEETCTSVSRRRGWTVVYSVLHVLAIGLIIAAMVLFILQAKEKIPWWCFLLIFLGFLFSIFSTMIHAITPRARAWATLLHFIGVALLLVGFTFFVYYSIKAGVLWYTWLLYSLAILFGILAGGFEYIAKPNDEILPDECDPCATPCATPRVTPCGEIVCDDGITELANVAIITASRPIPTATISPLPIPVAASPSSQAFYADDKSIPVLNPHLTQEVPVAVAEVSTSDTVAVAEVPTISS